MLTVLFYRVVCEVAGIGYVVGFVHNKAEWAKKYETQAKYYKLIKAKIKFIPIHHV